MKLSKLIEKTDATWLRGSTEIDITGLDSDSRKITPGGMFIAIRGFEVDGHRFIPAALEKGAGCLVIEKDAEVDISTIPENITILQTGNSRRFLAEAACCFYDHPSSKLKLVGITGTSGKTTTSFMVKKILEEQGMKVGLIGTVAIYIGDRKLKDSARTTPESIELQQLFYQMVQEGCDAAVIEVSSQSLKLDRVAGCDFAVGLFTNFSREHISKNEHPTMEDYFECKMKLFPMCRRICANIDDEKGREVVKRFGAARTFGITGEGCDVHGGHVELTNKSTKFDVTVEGKTYDVVTYMPTRFSAYNALAAASIALELGISIETVIAGLAKVRVPGRSELVDNKKNLAVIIDYAHIADSMESILKEIRSATKGKVICVFGCGGNRDAYRRPLMGKVSGTLADMTILTQDNPRGEKTEDIIADIEKGIKETTGKYEIVIDRAKAIERAISMAAPEDSVVLIGKGHETYQEIDHQKYHFDEREVVRSITDR